MMIVDHGFMEVVDAWDRKLSPLHQMVAPVEPPPHLWDKISAELGLVGPQPVVTEEPKPAEPAPVVVPPVETLSSTPEASIPIEPTEPDDAMLAKLLEPRAPEITEQSVTPSASSEPSRDEPVTVNVTVGLEHAAIRDLATDEKIVGDTRTRFIRWDQPPVPHQKAMTIPLAPHSYRAFKLQ